MSDESIVDLVRKSQAQEANPEQSSGAVQKMANISQAVPEDSQSEEIIQKLLSHVADKMKWVVVELPSQGLLYPEAQKAVQIRPIVFEDERILKSTQALESPEQALEKLLRGCVKGIDVSELTPQDKMYVLFRLRGISYGNTYTLGHDCSNCKTTSKLDLSINTIETTPLKESDMKFKLPDSQQDVQIKLPRTQDSELFSTIDKMNSNLHLFVHNVGGVTDKTIIESFLTRTTIRDVDLLRSRIFAPQYGMETDFFYSCSNCGTKNKVNIELTSSFFSAN
jgi:hypothetical protein